MTPVRDLRLCPDGRSWVEDVAVYPPSEKGLPWAHGAAQQTVTESPKAPRQRRRGWSLGLVLSIPAAAVGSWAGDSVYENSLVTPGYAPTTWQLAVSVAAGALGAGLVAMAIFSLYRLVASRSWHRTTLMAISPPNWRTGLPEPPEQSPVPAQPSPVGLPLGWHEPSVVPPKKSHELRNGVIGTAILVLIVGVVIIVSLAVTPPPSSTGPFAATTTPATTLSATTLPVATTVPGDDLEVCNAMATAIQTFVSTDNTEDWVVGAATLAYIQGTTQDPVLANDVALDIQASNNPGNADAVIYGSAIFKECRSDFPNNAHLTQTWDNLYQAYESQGY